MGNDFVPEKFVPLKGILNLSAKIACRNVKLKALDKNLLAM